MLQRGRVTPRIATDYHGRQTLKRVCRTDAPFIQRRGFGEFTGASFKFPRCERTPRGKIILTLISGFAAINRRRSPASSQPIGELGRLSSDGGLCTMSGQSARGVGQNEQAVADRRDNGREV